MWLLIFLVITQEIQEPQKFKSIIGEASLENTIDKDLISAVIFQESRFSKLAVSAKGARGPMQIMISTGKDLGLDSNELFDTEKNIKGGTRYLKGLLDKYQNVELALAGYNWGPGNLDNSLSQKGKNWKESLSDETRQYIPSVLKWYKNQKSDSNWIWQKIAEKENSQEDSMQTQTVRAERGKEIKVYVQGRKEVNWISAQEVQVRAQAIQVEVLPYSYGWRLWVDGNSIAGQ